MNTKNQFLSTAIQIEKITNKEFQNYLFFNKKKNKLAEDYQIVYKNLFLNESRNYNDNYHFLQKSVFRNNILQTKNILENVEFEYSKKILESCLILYRKNDTAAKNIIRRENKNLHRFLNEVSISTKNSIIPVGNIINNLDFNDTYNKFSINGIELVNSDKLYEYRNEFNESHILLNEIKFLDNAIDYIKNSAIGKKLSSGLSSIKKFLEDLPLGIGYIFKAIFFIGKIIFGVKDVVSNFSTDKGENQNAVLDLVQNLEKDSKGLEKINLQDPTKPSEKKESQTFLKRVLNWFSKPNNFAKVANSKSPIEIYNKVTANVPLTPGLEASASQAIQQNESKKIKRKYLGYDIIFERVNNKWQTNYITARDIGAPSQAGPSQARSQTVSSSLNNTQQYLQNALIKLGYRLNKGRWDNASSEALYEFQQISRVDSASKPGYIDENTLNAIKLALSGGGVGRRNDGGVTFKISEAPPQNIQTSNDYISNDDLNNYNDRVPIDPDYTFQELVEATDHRSLPLWQRVINYRSLIKGEDPKYVYISKEDLNAYNSRVPIDPDLNDTDPNLYDYLTAIDDPSLELWKRVINYKRTQNGNSPIYTRQGYQQSSSVPTSAPTSVPTSAPTSVPTSVPSSVPTSAPTSVPTPIETKNAIDAVSNSTELTDEEKKQAVSAIQSVAEKSFQGGIDFLGRNLSAIRGIFKESFNRKYLYENFDLASKIERILSNVGIRPVAITTISNAIKQNISLAPSSTSSGNSNSLAASQKLDTKGQITQEKLNDPNWWDNITSGKIGTTEAIILIGAALVTALLGYIIYGKVQGVSIGRRLKGIFSSRQRLENNVIMRINDIYDSLKKSNPRMRKLDIEEVGIQNFISNLMSDDNKVNRFIKGSNDYGMINILSSKSR